MLNWASHACQGRGTWVGFFPCHFSWTVAVAAQIKGSPRFLREPTLRRNRANSALSRRVEEQRCKFFT